MDRAGRGSGAKWGRVIALLAMVVLVVASCGGPGATGEGSPSLAPAASPGPTLAPSASVSTASASASASPTSVPLGGPVPAGFTPRSVTFVSPDDGWLLGEIPCLRPEATTGDLCAAVARTTDGGRTWRAAGAPRTTIAPRIVPGIGGVTHLRFATPAIGYAYGPELWVTRDGGATWRRAFPDLAVAAAPAGGAVLALESAGGLAQVAFVTEADPSTVRIATSPIGRDDWTVAAMTVPVGGGPVPETEIVLQGSTGWLMQIDREVVGGARLAEGGWSVWVPPCLDGASPGLLSAPSARLVVAACDEGVWHLSTGVRIWRSTDGGAVFGRVAQDPTEDPPLTGLEALGTPPGSETVVLGGLLRPPGEDSDGTSADPAGAGLVASFDGGRHWSTVLAPVAGAGFSELGFTTVDQGVAIRTTTGPAAGAALVMTRDGGRTWREVALR